MQIQVVGLNHRTAPVQLREKLAFDADSRQRALAELRMRHPSTEAVLLSTCNRVELYWATPEGCDGPDTSGVTDFLAGFHQVPRGELQPHLFSHQADNAVRHLFEVAGGLDSMVLGEAQILSQVKEGWNAAGLAGSSGRVMNRLFQAALETAKRVRTETAIGVGKLSVSSIAVDLARGVFDRFDDKTVLLVGAGKMSELTLKHLLELRPAAVWVCNRSADRATVLATKYGAIPHRFDQLYDLLARADIVISSTGAKQPVIRAEPFAEVVARRRFRTMFLIDIAVPRDIEPAVANASANVWVYNIDDLNGIIARTAESRAREVSRCREIIDQEVAEFGGWLDTLEVGPLIGRVRTQAQAIAEAELARLRPKLTGNPETDWPLIEQAFHRTTNKLLHGPIERVKTVARGGAAEEARPMLGLFRKLFGLGE